VRTTRRADNEAIDASKDLRKSNGLSQGSPHSLLVNRLNTRADHNRNGT
jgi:hypothetical protein